MTRAGIRIRRRSPGNPGDVTTVFARRTASFTRRASGTRVEPDGAFVLTFDDAGLCRELPEWYRRETPAT